MYLFVGVAAYFLTFGARCGVTSPITDANQVFENLRDKDGIIDSIPASLLPNIHPSKGDDFVNSFPMIGISQRSEEDLSPVLRFLITTITSTVYTTVSTQTSILSTWSTCFSTEADIKACTPTSGQVTVGTGRRKRESPHVVTKPQAQPIATLDGKDIDFNDIISPSRASRQNYVESTEKGNSDNLSNDDKDGRARIVDPPRYEEVGISGLPLMDENCKSDKNGVDNKLQEYQQPRFITIHSTSTSSVTATTTNTVVQNEKQTLYFSKGGCYPQQLLVTSLSISAC